MNIEWSTGQVREDGYMYLFKGLAVGGLAAVAVTIIYVIVEMRKDSAIAQAAGFSGQVGLALDLSALMRDPQYLFIAVGTFGVAFLLALYRRK